MAYTLIYWWQLPWGRRYRDGRVPCALALCAVLGLMGCTSPCFGAPLSGGLCSFDVAPEVLESAQEALNPLVAEYEHVITLEDVLDSVGPTRVKLAASMSPELLGEEVVIGTTAIGRTIWGTWTHLYAIHILDSLEPCAQAKVLTHEMLHVVAAEYYQSIDYRHEFPPAYWGNVTYEYSLEWLAQGVLETMGVCDE